MRTNQALYLRREKQKLHDVYAWHNEREEGKGEEERRGRGKGGGMRVWGLSWMDGWIDVHISCSLVEP